MIHVQRLAEALTLVCPIEGVSIHDPLDFRTWRIDFKQEATEAERQAALNVIKNFSFSKPLPFDIKQECQRRIIELTGATDLQSCMIKQFNALMRAVELTNIKLERDLTEQEQLEAGTLEALAEMIKALRKKSDEIEQNIPEDFTDNKYWS